MTKTITLQPGDIGADFVYLTNTIKSRLLDHHARFVIRYCVPSYTTSINKDLKDWEIEWYAEHNIALFLNWEVRHNDADSGAPRGKWAGEWLKDKAEELGVPYHVPLFVSVDQNTTQDNIRQHRAYVNAFKEAVAPYAYGVYGDTNIAAAVEEEYFWRANAKAWGAPSPAAPVHIQQSLPLYPPGIDPNTVMREIPAWIPGDGPVIQPPPREDHMTVFLIQPANPNFKGGIFTVDGHPVSQTLIDAMGADPNTTVVVIEQDHEAWDHVTYDRLGEGARNWYRNA